MFSSVIDSTVGLTAESALICTAASAVLGILVTVLYRLNNPHPSKNLMVSLVVLPILVQTVIMLVSGSVGAGIAVMGAFNLVRFRSVPGTSRELCYVFYAMGIGLATGMGYIGFAVLVAIAVGVILVILNFIPAFKTKRTTKMLKVIIPEDMNYTNCFNDLFGEYLANCRLISSKTISMGTLFELKYEVELKAAEAEKDFIDKIRARNGNLVVSMSVLAESHEEM